MSSTLINFTVPGHPKGKGIPGRGKHGGSFTDPLVAKYLELIRLMFYAAGYRAINDAENEWGVRLDIFYTGRCDVDKILNSFMDALQAPHGSGILGKGCVWHNDCQVSEVIIHRKRDDKERVCVELWRVE